MTERVKFDLIKKFFSNEDFRIYPDNVSQGLLMMNEKGIVVLANQVAQEVCFALPTDLTPFISYDKLIAPDNRDILESINDVYQYRKDGVRQLAKDKKTYLVESKTVQKNGAIRGCIVTLTDITPIAQKERQQELLYQLSTALSGIHDLPRVLQVAVSQILQSMAISAANIMLFDKKTNRLTIQVDTNEPAKKLRPRSFKLGEGVAGKCALELQPYTIYDVNESNLYIKKRPGDKGALLVVPIATKGKLIGVLNVRDDNPRFFTESEVQFLRIVANEIAIAIENTLLYDTLQRRIEQLSKMFGDTSFLDLRNIDTGIQRFIRDAPGLFDAEQCCLYLHLSKENRLVLKYKNGDSDNLPREIDLRDPRYGQINLYDEEPTIITPGDSLATEELATQHGIRNVLMAPVVINSTPIGMLAIFNKYNGPFNDEDRNMSLILARRLSTRIENARLVEKSETERELLDKVIENSSEGVAVLDKNKRIIVWNRYMEELTGLNSTEVVGQPCYKVFYQKLQLKKLTYQLYTQEYDSKATERVHDIEEELTTCDGEKVWVSSLYSYIMGEKAVENTILVVRNISREREHMQAKNEFISLTTHELRTPLTAIKGYLSMVINGDVGKLTAKQKQYFNKAYQATERLVNLVEELLNVVRLEENEVKFNFAPFPINDLVAEVVEDFRQSAEDKKLQIRANISQNYIVRGDRDRTKQILANLVDNALKYTPKGGIIVSTSVQGDALILSVEDTGVGIPAKHLNSVFDRFVRIPNALSVKAGGTGLGLYIVKNLVERQGGQIWVSSQLGKGTTFSFSLPLVAINIQTDSARKERSKK